MDYTPLVRRVYQELCLSKQKTDSDLQSQLSSPLLQASALYITKCFYSWKRPSTSGDRPRNGGLPLSEILSSLDINIFEFFKRLPVVWELLEPKFCVIFGTEVDVEWVTRLNEWRKLLVYNLILSRKYKDLFEVLFLAKTESLLENKMFRFGWLMFVLEKSQLLSEFPDLESCFHLLLCTCNFLLAYTPNSFWDLGFRSLLKKYNLENAEEMSTLKKLAIVNNINGAEEHARLEELMHSVESSIFDLLGSRINVQSQPSLNKRPQKHPSSEENVLDPKKPLLDDFLEVLDSKYREFLSSDGECDERMFLGQATSPVSPNLTFPTLTTSTESLMKLPISIGAIFSEVLPISLTEWIVQFCIELSLQPSEELQSCIGGPDCEVLMNIDSALYIQAKKLFPVNVEGSNDLSEEAVYAIKLFYAVLDRLVHKDSAKMASMLTSKTLPQVIMVCAFETVVFCLNLEHLLFPVLLNLLQLKAFDLSKLTDLFIRLFPEMPQKLKQHFEEIEAQIIESLAWIAGSSLYPLILETSLHQGIRQTEEMDVVQPLFPVVSQPLPGLCLDHRSPSSAFKIVPSSRSEGKRTAKEALITPTAVEMIPECLGPAHQVHQVESLSRVVLEDFFRKELKLAATRLLSFKFALDFSPLSSSLVMIMVYKMLKYALYEQTSLFYNRHLDQLVMSALYGVCRVNRLSTNFKEIISQYKTQPRHQLDIYRSVVLQQSNPTFTVLHTCFLNQKRRGEWALRSRKETM